MFRTFRAARFLFLGPVILAVLVMINLLTSPGNWWVQWPALGIGIAWFISLFRVLTALVVAGGLAGLVAYFNKRTRSNPHSG